MKSPGSVLQPQVTYRKEELKHATRGWFSVIARQLHKVSRVRSLTKSVFSSQSHLLLNPSRAREGLGGEGGREKVWRDGMSLSGPKPKTPVTEAVNVGKIIN